GRRVCQHEAVEAVGAPLVHHHHVAEPPVLEAGAEALAKEVGDAPLGLHLAPDRQPPPPFSPPSRALHRSFFFFFCFSPSLRTTSARRERGGGGEGGRDLLP